MVAVKKYLESEYLGEFSDYITNLFSKWLGVHGAKGAQTRDLLEGIENRAKENYRITYLKLLLPYLSETHLFYYKANEREALLASNKIVHSMLVNDIRYNDNNLNRLAEILLALSAMDTPLLQYPLHADYADVQKLIWTFIVQFKKSRNLPLVSDGRVEIY